MIFLNFIVTVSLKLGCLKGELSTEEITSG